jgi:four helix bundle protein
VTIKQNIIVDKTFAFAVRIAYLYKKLKLEKEFQIGNQLFRSAGSIGANVEEAQAAQSKKDFVSKISIACKEARETRFWLRVTAESQLIDIDLKPYIQEIDEIISILTRIIKTSTEKAQSLPLTSEI